MSKGEIFIVLELLIAHIGAVILMLKTSYELKTGKSSRLYTILIWVLMAVNVCIGLFVLINNFDNIVSCFTQ